VKERVNGLSELTRRHNAAAIDRFHDRAVFIE